MTERRFLEEPRGRGRSPVRLRKDLDPKTRTGINAGLRCYFGFRVLLEEELSNDSLKNPQLLEAESRSVAKKRSIRVSSSSDSGVEQEEQLLLGEQAGEGGKGVVSEKKLTKQHMSSSPLSYLYNTRPVLRSRAFSLFLFHSYYERNTEKREARTRRRRCPHMERSTNNPLKGTYY
ncbi:unnamed protein product [Lepeophtheirus salmonis]|uniref:(salmon louse) hypothetical protein n=1 Tax=Lepeophtheirus salmonis TaxID=72036 RepID=A0A7R8CF94_LEPSM|nr:unnamed protein product [Lepeophtheirus salmonis]CAF2798772.1 unnamed protein product [Lepeophtheirus salmonis]